MCSWTNCVGVKECVSVICLFTCFFIHCLICECLFTLLVIYNFINYYGYRVRCWKIMRWDNVVMCNWFFVFLFSFGDLFSFFLFFILFFKGRWFKMKCIFVCMCVCVCVLVCISLSTFERRRVLAQKKIKIFERSALIFYISCRHCYL